MQRRVKIIIIAVLVLALVADIIFILYPGITGQPPGLPGLGFNRTVVKTIVNSRILVLPGDAEYWRISVPQGASNPRLVLKLDILEGGNLDLDVYVRDSAGQMIYGERVEGYVERTIQLPGPGQYKLIVSNAFSIVTSKTAEIEVKLVYNT